MTILATPLPLRSDATAADSSGPVFTAALPGFKGLVDEIYNIVGSNFTDIEREAYEREQYDATLDLLEQRLVDRTAVRLARIQVLGCISFMSMQPSFICASH